MSVKMTEITRPMRLAEYIGQPHITPNLLVFIHSAKERIAALDHILLTGPPGLGKTTLSGIIANELGTTSHIAMGPSLQKVQDIIKVLGELKFKDVLFIDEIHTLPNMVTEILYPVMEDFIAEFPVGAGKLRKIIRAQLDPFTLIGATTRAGEIPKPMRDRFGIHFALEMYNVEDLISIILSGASKLSLGINGLACREIAKRSRGTPRIALRLLRRMQDFKVANKWDILTKENVSLALEALGIDEQGLEAQDHRYLECLSKQFEGGPVGVETLASALNEERDVVENMIEPYLLQIGKIIRTSRGRMIATKSEFGNFKLMEGE